MLERLFSKINVCRAKIGFKTNEDRVKYALNKQCKAFLSDKSNILTGGGDKSKESYYIPHFIS